MALVLADRVQEYSTTTGTGTLTLSGAYAGFQTFAAGIGNGNTCYYTITSDKNQWEVGIGTVGVGTLARTTLISSSTRSTIDFKGTLTVFVTYPAENAVYSDSTTIVAPSGALLPITNGGTGASTAANARTALGLGTIATQAADAVAITGGSINGTTVGSTTAAAGSFTTLNSSGVSAVRSLTIPAAAFAVGLTSGFSAGGTWGTSAAIFGNVTASGTGIGSGAVGIGFDTTTGGQIASAVPGVAFYNLRYSALLHDFYTTNFRQVQITSTPSAVNYLTLTGAVTGAAPTISAQGSDANIGLVLTGKGTGVVALGGSTVANSAVQISPVASAVNYALMAGATTGTYPSWSAQGTDAAIGFRISTKGIANFNFMGNNFGQYILTCNPVASAVNFLQVLSAVTTGAPELSAQGSDANINLKLTPKGTGVLQFGTYTAGVLTPTGYITITDAGGASRRLLVG